MVEPATTGGSHLPTVTTLPNHTMEPNEITHTPIPGRISLGQPIFAVGSPKDTRRWLARTSVGCALFPPFILPTAGVVVPGANGGGDGLGDNMIGIGNGVGASGRATGPGNFTCHLVSILCCPVVTVWRLTK